MQDYFKHFFPNGIERPILVAEDDEPVRVVLTHLLRLFGFRNVLTASNGHEALDIYLKRKDEILLVLTDIQMHTPDGKSAYGDELLLRLHELGQNARVVMMSGNHNFDTTPFKEKGLKGFLKKPIDVMDLVRALSSALM